MTLSREFAVLFKKQAFSLKYISIQWESKKITVNMTASDNTPPCANEICDKCNKAQIIDSFRCSAIPSFTDLRSFFAVPCFRHSPVSSFRLLGSPQEYDPDCFRACLHEGRVPRLTGLPGER